MGTRSTIGMLNDNGSIDYIYSHWDGYFDGVGKMLHSHYNDTNKVAELLSYGDLSSLEPTIADTTFYGRDRGETGVTKINIPAGEVDVDVDPMLAMIRTKENTWAEFTYLWDGKQWLGAIINDNYISGKTDVVLADILAKSFV